jgi:hypothetical protein
MKVTVSKGKVIFDKEASKWSYIKGTAQWAHIIEPNQFDKFSIDLYGDEVEEHAEELENLLDEAYQAVEEAGKKIAGKADIYRVNDETGEKYLQFGMNAEYDGKPNKIDIYDVYGKKIPDFDKLIGNGSIVKIKVQFKPYYMASTKMVGLSKKFYALQLIDLKEYGGSDGGFGNEAGDDTTPFDTNEEF